MILHYDIGQVRPYINWIYFYHAWDMTSKANEEREALRSDAERLLDEWEGKYHTHGCFKIAEANSDGDDILIEEVRFPMLRQQHPAEANNPNLCLADFVRPKKQGIPDQVGLFCTTVDTAIQPQDDSDPYYRMLAQTLADRLAEATTELMHLEVRRQYWGYAPDEQLSISDLLVEKYQGIRPAVGYPSIPDFTINFLIDRVLDMSQIGIRLTESGMMQPHASVSGLMFAHPQSKYFNLGPIGEDQFSDYVKRRGLPEDVLRKFLYNSLVNK